MSRAQQRAAVLLMLHHQACGLPPGVPPAPALEAVIAPPGPVAWWRRLLAWVRARYDLADWDGVA